MIFTEEGNEYMQKFNDATMNMEYSEFSANYNNDLDYYMREFYHGKKFKFFIFLKFIYSLPPYP